MRMRILLALAGMAVARPDSLEDVLARMDTAAKAFKSYSANVKRLDYTKSIDDKDETIGSMRLKRAPNGIVGIMDSTSGPDHTVIHFNGPTLERYLPKASTIEVYNTRKFASTVDQMLLLGFSITRDEMLRDYTIKLAGTETVDSTPTTHLVLTPKSTEALKIVKTIELWIPDGKGNPIRQKGNFPSGDYKLATFSDLLLNPPLPDSAFQLSAPPGTKRVKEN
jgi:outer membrane lipoprotein-sorting protein